MKILLIDDNKEITNSLEQYLIMMDFEVKVANSGKKGLELIQKGKFDVILLDLQMPEISGEDILAHLTKYYLIKKCNIIIFTASSIRNEQINRWIKLGVNSVIKKPINMKELIAIIKKNRK